MKKLLTALLVTSLLFTSCTPSQLSLAQTIINDVITFLPILTSLLGNPNTRGQATVIQAWLNRTVGIADDILNSPNEAGYLQASADFTNNVLPALPGLSETQIAALTTLSNDIQSFINKNPVPPVSQLLKPVKTKKASIFWWRNNGMSRGEIKQISDMKAQVNQIKGQLARLK